MLNENLTNVSVDAWHMEPMSQICFDALSTWKATFTKLKTSLMKHLFHFVRLIFLQLRASNKKNKTKFIEKPLDEPEATYDPQWLQDKVVSCMDLMTENRSHVQFSTACDAKYRKALATLANQN